MHLSISLQIIHTLSILSCNYSYTCQLVCGLSTRQGKLSCNYPQACQLVRRLSTHWAYCLATVHEPINWSAHYPHAKANCLATVHKPVSWSADYPHTEWGHYTPPPFLQDFLGLLRSLKEFEGVLRSLQGVCQDFQRLSRIFKEPARTFKDFQWNWQGVHKESSQTPPCQAKEGSWRTPWNSFTPKDSNWSPQESCTIS